MTQKLHITVSFVRSFSTLIVIVFIGPHKLVCLEGGKSPPVLRFFSKLEVE